MGFSHCCLRVRVAWRLALQLSAFKEHPPGPPVTVLLNKHGTAQRSQWAQMKSSPQERDPITWPVVHSLGESGAISIVPSGLAVCFKAWLMKLCLGFHQAPWLAHARWRRTGRSRVWGALGV